jgi:hypothetical protein
VRRRNFITLRSRQTLVVALVASLATVLVLGAVEGIGAITGSSGSSSPRPRPVPLPAAKQLTLHGAVSYSGGTYGVATFTNAEGQLCIGERIPREGQGFSCTTREQLFSKGPVALAVGSRQGPTTPAGEWETAWVYGVAAPSVASLELLSTDCSRQRFHPDDAGIFYHLIPPGDFKRGAWPYRLYAYAENGQVVWSGDIPLSRPTTQNTAAPRPVLQAGCAS